MVSKEPVIAESPTAEERAFQQHVDVRGKDDDHHDEEEEESVAEGEGEEHNHDEGAAIALPDSGEATEGGKLKMIVSLLKKCLGVKDLASMRLSLPASLLEPIPNLEYWHYLDRPDLMAAINDSEDPFERMLAVVRFNFSKDLKIIRGKVVKPYNSVLGEHFRAHWDFQPVEYPEDPRLPPIHKQHVTAPAPSEPAPANGTGKVATSRLSFRSAIFGKTVSGPTSPIQRPASAAPAVESNLAAQVSNLSLGGSSTTSLSAPRMSTSSSRSSSNGGSPSESIRTVYLTEQVSHHPPVSAYYATCPARGVDIAGIDQISAKVSGTCVRITPGSFNKGIFVKLTSGNGKGEQYKITHPIANVNGMLRGSFYVTVSESIIITCEKEGASAGQEMLRTVVEFKEEPWIGKPQFQLDGVIHTYRVGETEHEEWTKVKHVPANRVVAQFDGSWRSQIRWKRAPGTAAAAVPKNPATQSSTSLASGRSADAEYGTLIDIEPLQVMPKRVRPLNKQHDYESRKLWDNVTSRLVKREFGDATKHKQAIEQRQRDLAGKRKEKGEEFIPTYFEKDIASGIPVLTAEGLKAIEEEMKVSDGRP